MKLDILVVAFHARKELAQTLSSIAHHTSPGYRLTVHDNTAVNYPLSWLWNKFAERSTRDLVAFLNADIVVGPGWDTEIRELFSTYPGVASAMPLSNYPPHKTLGELPGPDDQAEQWIGPLTEDRKQTSPRFHWGKNHDLVSGHCMVVRRPIIKVVGGFSELYPFANNDYDFNSRVIKAGGALGVSLHSVVLHWWNASSNDAKAKGLMKEGPVFVKPPHGLKFENA